MSSVITGYVPKRMRRFGAWNQNRAVLGVPVDLPISNRNQISDFAKETDTLLGHIPSGVAEGLTLGASRSIGEDFTLSEITLPQRSQDFTFGWTMIWDNPSGLIFHVGSSVIGLAVAWINSTSFAAVVDDGTTSTFATITVPAIQSDPTRVLIAFDVSTGELQTWVDGIADAGATVGATPTWANLEDGRVGSINGSAVGGISAPATLSGCTISDPGVVFYPNQLPASF